MSVYLFGQVKEYDLAGLDYRQTYQQQVLGKLPQQALYVCAQLPEQKDMELYRRAGVCAEQVLGVHRYLADHCEMTASVRAKDKLEELKDSLQATGVEERESEIWLIRDGCVIATIALEEGNREYCRGIYYYSFTRLIRAEYYQDGIAYAEYFKTAESERGLYAKLVRRSFYNRDGSAAYDQIFAGDQEWYLFPDGRRCSKPQLMAEFVRRLNLSAEDIVVLDETVPNELTQAVFTYGKAARIAAVVHAGCSLAKGSDHNEALFTEYPYRWFRYAEALDLMVVSTKEQRGKLIQELEAYHCKVPDIQVYSVEGEFTYTVLRESYGGGMALSWSFQGRPDGFWIYDESGKRICETRNIHQHYIRIEGYEAEHGFAVKAFVDTVNGKMAIAETGLVYPHTGHYDIPRVSLVIPVYNAEAYIARTLDNALAQSLPELEILAVDDGCTDSTPKILDWYAGKYPNVVVIHKENGGVAAARNTGIEAAKGGYIGFMDNDDMIRPEMMEQLYDSARRNDCDVVCTSAYEIKENGYEAFMHYPMEENVAVSFEEFVKLHFTKGYMWTVNVWNKLYHSQLVKEHPFPVLVGDDEAWTPYILSWADHICWINDHLYEHDRVIRSSTLFHKWMKQSDDELWNMHINASIFYLKEGNPQALPLLKELVRRGVYEWGKYYASDKYERVWNEINNMF